MKIYKVTVSEVQYTSAQAMLSSTISPRYEKRVEYYLTKELADQRAKAIYEGMLLLTGFIPNIEARVSEVEVKESL